MGRNRSAGRVPPRHQAAAGLQRVRGARRRRTESRRASGKDRLPTLSIGPTTRFAFRSPRCLITALAGMASCLAVCWTGSAYSASAKPSADMPLENKISICYRTKDDQQRLKCYDAAIQAEVDKYKSSQDVLREEWHGNGLLTTRPFHTNPR